MLWEEIHGTLEVLNLCHMKENIQVSWGLKVHGKVFNSTGDVNNC